MVYQVRTQEGNIFMEQNNKILMATPNAELASIMARYRQVCKKYGEYFSSQIYTIVSHNPDLKWKEDVQNDKNTLRKDVRIFIVKPIDITGIELCEKDFDGHPKVILNPKSQDPSLVFDLAEPNFQKATRESVMACIATLTKPNDPTNPTRPIFFGPSELPQLNTCLKMHNSSILNFYEEQARKNMQLAETVRNIMDQQDRAQVEYLRQCGITNEDQVEVNVTIEQVQG